MCSHFINKYIPLVIAGYEEERPPSVNLTREPYRKGGGIVAQYARGTVWLVTAKAQCKVYTMPPCVTLGGGGVAVALCEGALIAVKPPSVCAPHDFGVGVL